MINFLNKEYYIDIDEAIKSCQVIDNVVFEDEKITEDDGDTKDETEEYSDDNLQINVFKFEIIKMCIDRVLNHYEDTEDISSLYSENKSFKVAFATLIKNKILIEFNEYDEFE